MKRFVIEGEWSGYRSSQQRVVHRVVSNRKNLIEWCDRVHGITFTDGTTLYLTVRPALPRESVQQIHGYDSLISRCFYANVTSVAALNAKTDAAPTL